MNNRFLKDFMHKDMLQNTFKTQIKKQQPQKRLGKVNSRWIRRRGSSLGCEPPHNDEGNSCGMSGGRRRNRLIPDAIGLIVRGYWQSEHGLIVYFRSSGVSEAPDLLWIHNFVVDKVTQGPVAVVLLPVLSTFVKIDMVQISKYICVQLNNHIVSVGRGLHLIFVLRSG